MFGGRGVTCKLIRNYTLNDLRYWERIERNSISKIQETKSIGKHMKAVVADNEWRET